MRQLLRTTATVFVALVFTAGMAFGQSTATADVEQSGSNNNANVNQNITGGPSLEAFVEQTVGSAEADIDQITDNSGKKNVVDVKQSGNNLAEVQQGAQGKIGLSNSEVRLTQNNTEGSGGKLNEAYINQFSGGAKVKGVRQSRSLQEGVGNFLEITQEVGFTAKALTEQVGNNNRIELSQTSFGGGAEVAEIVQEGNENAARLTQEGGAFADVDQFGDNNLLRGFDGPESVAQQGSDATLTLQQNGSENAAWVYQESNNIATITQNSTGDVAKVHQMGSSNTATVTQN
jgi:hypothetical protein